MLVGRVTKESTSIRRVIVPFSAVLDSGEVIQAVPSITVTTGESGWSVSPYTTVPVSDPTPLEVLSPTLVSSNTALQMLLTSGTPGVVYTVQFVADGSTSGRAWTCEIEVQISGQATSLPTPVNSATSLLALPLGGGTMLGPLYLSEDPQTPPEAATKRYVDSATATFTNDLADEQTARINADTTLQANITTEVTRAEAAEAALLADLNTAKVLVAGAGLNGGSITLSGTAAVTGTISANWQAATVLAVANGLSIASSTLIAGWNGGSVAALDSSLTLNTGTLAVTTPSTWTAGTVSAIGSSLTLTAGTLSVADPSAWNGGSVAAIGSGLTLNAGTLSASAVEWSAGAVSAIGSGLTISSGTLTASGGASSVQTGSVVSATATPTVVNFPTAFATACNGVYISLTTLPTDAGTGAPVYTGWYVNSRTKTGFEVTFATTYGGINFDWVAYGD